ncbi:hypothetical protein [Tuwongella immobilis]|uniref:hypothetical protein n=1 Tax=Tuwongella immobilis TaxID=692036 RepID=UPI0013A6D940|nr:hypothetical protein [Tuwongella immobilis]
MTGISTRSAFRTGEFFDFLVIQRRETTIEECSRGRDATHILGEVLWIPQKLSRLLSGLLGWYLEGDSDKIGKILHKSCICICINHGQMAAGSRNVIPNVRWNRSSTALQSGFGLDSGGETGCTRCIKRMEFRLNRQTIGEGMTDCFWRFTVSVLSRFPKRIWRFWQHGNWIDG